MHSQNQSFLHQNYLIMEEVQGHDKHCMDYHLLKKYLNHLHLIQKSEHYPIQHQEKEVYFHRLLVHFGQ